jgi:Domain of Unknown Function (DUF1080)
MKRLTFISMGLLAIGFIVFGCATQPSRQADAGWITLIDGANGLDNWNRVGTVNWTAAEGVVQADKSEKGGGFLVSKNSHQDFVIRVEFWVSDDANSGIYMRCADRKTLRIRAAMRRISTTSDPTRLSARGPSCISPRYHPCLTPAANGTPMRSRQKARALPSRSMVSRPSMSKTASLRAGQSRFSGAETL